MLEKVLSPARAYGAPVIVGTLKAEPEHFQVREWLGFAADGDGEHALLIVRKRNANTLWVARALARYAGLAPRDIGFAGLKDRRAVTEQAFTVPLGKRPVEFWEGMQGEGFEVLSAARHRRKLRRGAHKGNDFRIVLDRIEGDAAALQQRLQVIARDGVPNYFGAQRFGHDGRNLKTATAWLGQGAQPRDRAQRGFALSAARAAIFNLVASERVGRGDWNQLLAGDVANLNGTGSIFAVDNVDAELQRRCAELDLHPTGPLWGKGESPLSGAPAELERSVADRCAALSAGLAAQGLSHERRALRIQVRNLAWTLEGQRLILEFRLLRGAFATAVLGEIAAHAVDQWGDDDDA